MSDRKNEPRSAVAPTLGAVREKLIRNGYAPVSMLMPVMPEDPHSPWRQHEPQPPPPWLVSEHPVALQTRNSSTHLAALILTSPEDVVLDQRVRSVLEQRGLTRGPVRVGSDNRELYPLRAGAAEVRGSALAGAVELVGVFGGGMGTGLQGCLVPLDGAWQRGDLLSVPYDKLPALEDWRALISELDKLPYLIRKEQEPPPKPSRRNWLGGP